MSYSNPYAMTKQSQTKTLVAGAVIGALAGLIGAAIMIQSADRGNRSLKLTAGDGVKVGLSVLSVLRLISDL